MKTCRRTALPTLVVLLLSACSQGEEPSAAVATEAGMPSPAASACEPDDDGLELPDGFCAILVSDGVGAARHLEVADNGDVFVAMDRSRQLADGTTAAAGVAVLRDTDGDAHPDTVARWGEVGGNGILLHGGYVWFAPDDGVLRFPLEEGAMVPSGPSEVVVHGLPDTGNHRSTSMAIRDGSLFVNVGSASNACMEESRTPGSPGQDPCPELDTRAGIWRFDAGATDQDQADGTRFATGMRNTVALAVNPANDGLYGVVHGRDQLHGMFPGLFTVADNTEKPSEEFVRIDQGSDFGWPYCYHDPATGRKLLSPEYGGDGTEVGRCADKDMPIIGFPAHWAPDDLTFYDADQFPARYRNGAFIAFHGSWNRAPNPQDGFQIAFVPADGQGFSTEWETFADGFRNQDPSAEFNARPVGVAVGPDGSLYVTESNQGRIWRIVYRGE
jgi:glucose/arabinose dehydrogenase